MSKPVMCPICNTKMKIIYMNKHGHILYAVHSECGSKCKHGTNFMYDTAEAAVQAWNTVAGVLAEFKLSQVENCTGDVGSVENF